MHSGIWVKRNVAGKRLDGFTDLLGKAFESLHELLLMLIITATPIFTTEAVNEWFIDVVHNRVKSENGVFIKFTEKDFVVVGTLGSDRLAGWCTSHEVAAFTSKFELLTYKNIER